jgi:hypothetical protein
VRDAVNLCSTDDLGRLYQLESDEGIRLRDAVIKRAELRAEIFVAAMMRAFDFPDQAFGRRCRRDCRHRCGHKRMAKVRDSISAVMAPIETSRIRKRSMSNDGLLK